MCVCARVHACMGVCVLYCFTIRYQHLRQLMESQSLKVMPLRTMVSVGKSHSPRILRPLQCMCIHPECQACSIHVHVSTLFAVHGIVFFPLPPVANSQLRGGSDLDAALVLQYVNFADFEVLPAVCTWTFPTLGIMQPNQQVYIAGYIT